MMRKVICWVISICHFAVYVFPSISLAQNAPPVNSTEYLEAQSRLEQAFAMVDGIRSHIDRSQFELDALLDKLEYDSQQIIDFVTEDISFLQYTGVMRGARGTLMSRAGNSSDQALLLAKLLGDAGLDARIVETQLDATQTKRLVAQMKVRPTPAPPIGDTVAMTKIIQDFNTEFGAIDSHFPTDMAEPSESLRALVAKTNDTILQEAQFIRETLGEHGIKLGGSNNLEDLEREATQYYYVEYRDGPGNDWYAVHPVLNDKLGAFDSLTPQNYFKDSLPDSLLCKFSLEVLLSSQTLGKKRVQTLIPVWERPVALLIGQPITYTNLSRNMMSPEYLETGVLSSNEPDLFLPALNGNVQNNAFDLSGNIIPTDVAGSAYAALFQTIGNTFEGAAQSMSQLTFGSQQEAEPVRALTSIDVRYKLTVPGKKDQVFDRNIYDRTTSANMADPKRDSLKALTRYYTIAVGGGEMSLGFVLDQVIESNLARRAYMEAALKLKYGVISREAVAKEISGKPNIAWNGHFLLEALLGAVSTVRSDILTYVARPSITVHHRQLPIDEHVIESIDIVSRTLRAFSRSSLAPEPEHLIHAGVWNSTVESILIGEDWLKNSNTHTAFERERGKQAEFKILTSDLKHQVAKLKVPQITAKYIGNDLDKGNVIILAGNSSEYTDPMQYAWWRIDPKTGNTLGMSGMGEGATATEWLVLGTTILNSLLAICLVSRIVEAGGPAVDEDRLIQCYGAVIPVAGAAIGGAALMVGAPAAGIALLFSFAGVLLNALYNPFFD